MLEYVDYRNLSGTDLQPILCGVDMVDWLQNFLWDYLIKFCERQEKLLFIDIEEEMKQEFETFETILENVEEQQSRQEDHKYANLPRVDIVKGRLKLFFE